jgi:hypothetical protein
MRSGVPAGGSGRASASSIAASSVCSLRYAIISNVPQRERSDGMGVASIHLRLANW